MSPSPLSGPFVLEFSPCYHYWQSVLWPWSRMNTISYCVLWWEQEYIFVSKSDNSLQLTEFLPEVLLFYLVVSCFCFFCSFPTPWVNFGEGGLISKSSTSVFCKQSSLKVFESPWAILERNETAATRLQNRLKVRSKYKNVLNNFLTLSPAYIPHNNPLLQSDLWVSQRDCQEERKSWTV